MAEPASDPARPRRDPLYRNRDFVLLWTGQAVSVLGTRITSIAMPLLVLAMTGSPAEAGVVGFFGTLPYLVVQLPAGGYVDRWDRKRTMLVSDVIRAGALGSVAAAVWVGRIAIVHLAAVAFVDGSLSVVFGLAENAALTKVVPVEQLSTALAQNEARERAASLAGQPLGGLLYGVAQTLPFLADAVSYAVSVFTLLLVRTSFGVEERPPRDRLHREIAEGFRWLWNQPFLRSGALLIAGSNFVFQGAFLGVVVTARARGASSPEIGVILGLSGVGGVAGALLAPHLRRRIRTRGVIVGVNWFWAAILPLMAAPLPPIVLGPLFGAMMFAGPMWNVVFGTYELRLTPQHLLGRVQSVEMLMSWGAIPLGSLSAGLLFQRFEPGPAMLLLATVMTAIAFSGTMSGSLRHAPALPEDQPAVA